MHNADCVHAVAALTSVQSDNQSLFQEIIKREIITIQSFFKGAGQGVVVWCVCLQNIGSVVTAAKMTSTLDHSVWYAMSGVFCSLDTFP